MDGVDLMDQRTATYCLDRKSSVRFYLCIFFDLMNIACINSYLIYNMKHPNKLLMRICGWTTLTSQCPLENAHKRQQICQIRHEKCRVVHPLSSLFILRVIVMWQRLRANQIALFQECVVHSVFIFCLFFRKWSQKVWSTWFSFNSKHRAVHSFFLCLI